jgi:hypothetical protein
MYRVRIKGLGPPPINTFSLGPIKKQLNLNLDLKIFNWDNLSERRPSQFD